MRRTRHVVLPVRSWQYMGLMMVSLACLTLGLVSRDREGRSGSLAGPELMHTAPHEVDACPNTHPFTRLPSYEDNASLKGPSDEPCDDVRSRTSSDSRSAADQMSRARSVDRRAVTTRITNDRRFDVQNRRNVNTDRRSRSISMLHSDRSSTPSFSRSTERRENPGSLARGRIVESINRQQIDIDRQTRSIEMRSTRTADEEGLILRSRDHRFNDKDVRSRSHERKSVERRSDPAVRERNNDLSRRITRSASERDSRDVRSVRLSRSARQLANREQRSDSGRDSMRINDYVEDRRNGRVARLSRSRSEDVIREDIRGSGIRSHERRSSNRQAINPIERQKRSRDVRMARSRDIHPVETNNREGSDSRSSSESGESTRTGSQERRTNLLTRSRDVRRLQARDVRRVEERSEERRTSNPVERHENRINSLSRSRDARISRSRDTDRVDVRRVVGQSEERRKTTDQRVKNPVEYRDNRMNIRSRSRDVRLSRSRDANREDVRRVVDQSEERRRLTERRVTNPAEHRDNRMNIISRSRDVRLSRSRDAKREDVRRVVDQSEERRRTSDRRVTDPIENHVSILSRSRDVRISRSRDADRVDARRVVDQSEERRRTTDRRVTNPVEHRENRMNILSRSRDVRLSRSPDADRVDVSRAADQSEERRTTDRRATNLVNRHASRANILSRSQDERLSRSRDIRRVDGSRLEKRSAERKTLENRVISPTERQERRINILARSRDVRLVQSRDVSRLDYRREDSRTQERRFSERHDLSQLERPERRVDILATSRDVRRIESRDMNRADVRRSEERSQVQRFSERRGTNSIERLERRVRHSATSEDINRANRQEIRLHRSSIEQQNNNAVQRERRLNVRHTGYSSGRRSTEREIRQISWVDSLRRTTENRERLASVSREGRISRDITVRPTSSVNSRNHEVLSSRNSRVIDSENREHRGRSVQRNIHRQHRISDAQERQTSDANDRIDVGRKRTAYDIRINRVENNQEGRNARHQMISTDIPLSKDVGGKFNDETDYLRQAVILALCAVYSASLFKGKGGFYGNIFALTSRFVTS